MAIRKSVTVTGVGISAPIYLDWTKPQNCGVQLVTSGVATFSLQGTMDDMGSGSWDPSTANWFTIAVGITSGSGMGSISLPITAVRLNVSVSAASTTTMTIIQTGSSYS